MKENDLVDAEYLGISKLNKNFAITFNWNNKFKKHKQWIALISGIDPKYGYKREFLPSETSGVKANKNLTAFRFNLMAGSIYQYKNFLVDYLSDHLASGFLMVVNDGIIPLEPDQVRTYLNMPVRKGNLVRMPTMQPQGNYEDDDVPF